MTKVKKKNSGNPAGLVVGDIIKPDKGRKTSNYWSITKLNKAKIIGSRGTNSSGQTELIIKVISGELNHPGISRKITKNSDQSFAIAVFAHSFIKAKSEVDYEIY